jgi:hypothetical protein
MNLEFLFYTVIGFFAGIFLFFMGMHWYREKSLIENTPTSKIRSIAMGRVEIYGEVVPAEKKVLHSPLSGKECVYYRYAVEEYRSQGKYSSWVVVQGGEDRINFFLQDKTGAVLVDPNKAEIEIPKSFNFQSGLGKDPPKLVVDFLQAHGMSFEGFLGINKRMRFTEYLIAPGDKFYIMGTAGDNPFVEEGAAKESAEDIMIQKGGRSNFYYISNKAEKDVLKKFTWKTIGGLLGGGVLIVGSLALILINLNLI